VAAVDDAVGKLCQECDMDEWRVKQAAYRYDDATVDQSRFALSGLEGLVRLLAGFGAVTGGVARPVLTPLGRWAAGNLRDGLPLLADPSQTAAELIAQAARFADMAQRDHVVEGWLAGRDPTGAAREILNAAEGMPPLLRGVAVGVAELLGDDALPAWQEMAASSHIGPRVREVLASWDAGPQLSEADWRWLAVEAAAAALASSGPDEALTRVWESMPGADLDERLSAALATGHPDVAELVRAIAEFAASGAPRSVDQVAELKVSLARFRPPVWRRVQLPVTATLGDLHDVIQVLFGWDGDHLHEFRVGKKRYSDSFANLEGAEGEETVRLRDAFAGGGKVKYTYDFGTEWEHEVTLEKTLAREAGRKYPVCVAFRTDSPVEYWSGDEDEEDAAEPEPFDLAEVNKRLSAQG
jgi:Plasmid pRiA4b ORF-3-like protein